MIKVVWLVPGFSSAEHDWCIPALLDLARALGQRCELHVLALHYPYRREVYRIDNVIVHSLGGANRGRMHTIPLWREAIQVVNSLRPDVLHAFWAYEPGVIAARLARRLPTIIHLAGGELIDLPDIHYGLLGKWQVRGLMRWALRRASVITAGSRYLVEIANRFVGSPRTRLAPLGVDTRLFTRSDLRAAEALWPEHQPTPIILNVGSLEPVKDQLMLLHAFHAVLREIPQARLMIAGRGRLEPALHALADQLQISAEVDFVGEILHHELPTLYRAAEVMVQSSQHEAQGMAVLEAAACGVPIVGTAVGAVRDLAPEAAVSVPVGDINALAAAIIAVLRDRTQADRLVQAALAQVVDEYALDRATERFAMIYREMAGGKEISPVEVQDACRGS